MIEDFTDFNFIGLEEQPAAGIGLEEHSPNCNCGCRFIAAFDSPQQAWDAQIASSVRYREQKRRDEFWAADGGRI